MTGVVFWLVMSTFAACIAWPGLLSHAKRRGWWGW